MLRPQKRCPFAEISSYRKEKEISLYFPSPPRIYAACSLCCLCILIPLWINKLSNTSIPESKWISAEESSLLWVFSLGMRYVWSRCAVIKDKSYFIIFGECDLLTKSDRHTCSIACIWKGMFLFIYFFFKMLAFGGRIANREENMWRVFRDCPLSSCYATGKTCKKGQHYPLKAHSVSIVFARAKHY